MNILVTGSGGVLGHHIINRLIREGHNVVGCDRQKGYKTVQVDIFDSTGMDNLFKTVRPDVVYHLASVVGRVYSESQKYHAVNVSALGVIHVAELCLKYNSKMIFFSTSEVYGGIPLGTLTLDDEDLPTEPVNAYGAGKLMAENYLLYMQRTCNLKLMIVRPFMIYGGEPDSKFRSVLSRYLWSLKNGTTARVDLNCYRSWCYVDDLTEGVKDFKEGIYNIGNSERLDSIQALYDLSVAVSGKRANYEISGQPPNNITVNTKDPNFVKAERELGFKANISLAEGLRREWSRINGS